MNTKEKKLFQALDQAYMDPDVKKDPSLTAMIEENAKILNASDGNDAYIHAVANLANGISQYYLAHRGVPNVLMSIYQLIKADIPEAHVDADYYRKKAEAIGLSFFPVIFH
ncbi:MAG: bacteriocin immunity protein [Schleiferilactobacillus harbinensis]